MKSHFGICIETHGMQWPFFISHYSLQPDIPGSVTANSISLFADWSQNFFMHTLHSSFLKRICMNLMKYNQKDILRHLSKEPLDTLSSSKMSLFHAKILPFYHQMSLPPKAPLPFFIVFPKLGQ